MCENSKIYIILKRKEYKQINTLVRGNTVHLIIF